MSSAPPIPRKKVAAVATLDERAALDGLATHLGLPSRDVVVAIFTDVAPDELLPAVRAAACVLLNKMHGSAVVLANVADAATEIARHCAPGGHGDR